MKKGHSFMQIKISRMTTSEYADLRKKRLIVVKKKRTKETVSTPRHYLALVNGVSGNARILSRRRIESKKNNHPED